MKTALITGASGGIGLELAKLFARDGYNLVLVARSEQKLKQLAADLEHRHGVSVQVLAKDLSTPQSPAEIHAELQAQSITVNVLVNNAGYGTSGPFIETDLTTELQELQLNVVTLTHLTKLFAREMVRQRQGRILNVASTAAFQPGPLMAVYYATKAYVLSFSEALATELRGTGVTVTTLCPGATETGFAERAKIKSSTLFQSSRVMSAEAVARIGYVGLMAGKTLVIPGFLNKALAFSVRFAPRALVTQITRQLNKK